MRAFRTAIRTFGGATDNLREDWPYSSTPYLDMLVRITWFATAFVGFLVVLGIVLAEERAPYVLFALALAGANLALLGFRAWRRRQ